MTEMTGATPHTESVSSKDWEAYNLRAILNSHHMGLSKKN